MSTSRTSPPRFLCRRWPRHGQQRTLLGLKTFSRGDTGAVHAHGQGEELAAQLVDAAVVDGADRVTRLCAVRRHRGRWNARKLKGNGGTDGKFTILRAVRCTLSHFHCLRCANHFLMPLRAAVVPQNPSQPLTFCDCRIFDGATSSFCRMFVMRPQRHPGKILASVPHDGTLPIHVLQHQSCALCTRLASLAVR